MGVDQCGRPGIGGWFRVLAAGVVLLSAMTSRSGAQSVNGAPPPQLASAYPAERPASAAYPLPFDRGAVALWQSLRKLRTRASLIMIVAHPDDEDGGMLTYESRGQGADTTLLTLNRGEGGQNVMSSDYWDQLGLVRTQELLAADEYYGVHQYFSRVADFGFSKTIEESMKTWGHDRVLYDAVRVVRMTRPLVVTSSFTGNVSDGHGQHQVSGAIAQEVFKAAADPNVFPDQIKAGLQPWAPLKVYARVPFARTGDKGIYDSATGHWEPIRYRNYVEGTYIEGVPSATVSIPEGQYDPMLGRSYFQLAREGLGQQKSQNGGIAVPQFRPVSTGYHLYASRVSSPLPPQEEGFFTGIDTSLVGIADYAAPGERQPWRDRLSGLNKLVEQAIAKFDPADPAKVAPLLASGIAKSDALLSAIADSRLDAAAKYNMTHEIAIKRREFNDALQQALGIQVLATVTNSTAPGDSAGQPTSQTVIPDQTFRVNLHLANQGSQQVTVAATNIISHGGAGWKTTLESSGSGTAGRGALDAGDALDQFATVTVPDGAEPTRPYFSRSNVEQSYYDIDDQRYLNDPLAPYPLTAEVAYSYNGVTVLAASTVQTVRRLADRAPDYEPLLVAPAISLTVKPEAGIIPLNSTTFNLNVTLHSSVKGRAEGVLHLDLPKGWESKPSQASFQMAADGEEQIVEFEVTPMSVQARRYDIRAVAEYKGAKYNEGFQIVGYGGLRPYPFYRPAVYRTTGVDVKVAPALRIGYIMGTGDDVPGSVEDLGVHPTLLSAQDVISGDLSQYDAIVVGIRAYAARPDLKSANDRLLTYVSQGGVVIVQYQTGEYDHNYAPYPLTLSGDAEKVVEEDGEVSILAADDPVFSWPNNISVADFSGWIEERGHGFMRSWYPHYVALTEMHDVGQEPQQGGLLYARYGKGVYVYSSFAFFRQMPEGVPGAFRIFANLISIGKNPSFRGGSVASP
ncbi:MAG TPA: PIG-L family deacetylase [Acidisarcina sp.]